MADGGYNSGAGGNGIKIANPNNGGTATPLKGAGQSLDITNPNMDDGDGDNDCTLSGQSENTVSPMGGLKIANPNNNRSGSSGKGL